MKSFMIFLFLFLSMGLYSKKDISQKINKTEEATEAIEVKGQSRNFNMKLILRNKKDKISFVKTRKNYREEILSTEP